MAEYRGRVADLYSQYVDPERTYTDEQLRDWANDGPLHWAENRISQLCTLHKVLYKRTAQLGSEITLPTWWAKTQRRVKELLSIYPGQFNPPFLVVTEDEMGIGAMPDARSKEGRALTKVARDLDGQEWDWIHGLLGAALEALTEVASLQHNESSVYGWDRKLNSNGNKLMNKLHAHELRVWGQVRADLMSKQDRS